MKKDLIDILKAHDLSYIENLEMNENIVLVDVLQVANYINNLYGKGGKMVSEDYFKLRYANNREVFKQYAKKRYYDLKVKKPRNCEICNEDITDSHGSCKYCPSCSFSLTRFIRNEFSKQYQKNKISIEK